MVAGETVDKQVDPAIDDVGHRAVAGQKSTQQLFDAGPCGLDDRGGQLLLASWEVVIQGAGLRSGLREDLIEPGCGIALSAEQGGGGVDQGGPAAIRSRHIAQYYLLFLSDYSIIG